MKKILSAVLFSLSVLAQAENLHVPVLFYVVVCNATPSGRWHCPSEGDIYQGPQKISLDTNGSGLWEKVIDEQGRIYTARIEIQKNGDEYCLIASITTPETAYRESMPSCTQNPSHFSPSDVGKYVPSRVLGSQTFFPMFQYGNTIP
jgi:hypothetical protein